MDYKTRSFLEQLGLSKNEVKVYAAALRLGVSSAAALARAARVHRVAAYAVIDNLIKKGLLMQAGTQQKKLFAARHPRQIKSVLADQKRQMRKLELKYEEVLPNLLLGYNASGFKPQMTYYEGVDDLRKMNADIIETMSALPEKERVIYSYLNPTLFNKLFIESWTDDMEMRVENKIWKKVISSYDPNYMYLASHDAEQLRETIILQADKFPFANMLTIYSDKVAVQALDKELIGVIIESKEIADDQRTIFELAWAGAQSLS